MKRFVWLMAALLVLSACKDDDPAPDAKVLMTFDPRFGGNELQMGEVHDNLHGYPFSTTGMKFYLSNIRLISNSGSEVELSEIVLIDFMNNQRTLEYVIPEGNYVGVRFDLGVPVELNGTQNEDFSTSLYSADHPLSESNGMYWVWNTGYRFFIFEGRFDTVPNTTGSLPLTYAFHTGTDTLFRELGPFSKSMNLSGGETALLPFEIAVDSLFATATDTIDLSIENSFHGSPMQIDLGKKLADNMAKSFVLSN
jgi:hypothetical protein